jgi:peptidoglycan hydrolase-like protein with peptidoglycan-binding domain
VLAGAAIGAGAGAATGALTEPSTVNLGEPPWSNPDARVPGLDSADASRSRSGTSASGSRSSRAGGMASADVRNLQQALNNRGYSAGPADGVYGPRTREAVMAWQRANNMQATGNPSPQMMANLGVGNSATGGNDPNRAYMGGGAVGGGAGSGPAPQRDSAGHLMGGTQGSGANEPGMDNRSGTGSATLGTGSGGAPRDPAGHMMGGTQGSGAQEPGTGSRTPTGTGLTR